MSALTTAQLTPAQLTALRTLNAAKGIGRFGNWVGGWKRKSGLVVPHLYYRVNYRAVYGLCELGLAETNWDNYGWKRNGPEFRITPAGRAVIKRLLRTALEARRRARRREANA